MKKFCIRIISEHRDILNMAERSAQGQIDGDIRGGGLL